MRQETDAEALYRSMKERNIRIGEMCDKLCMSRSAFYRKTNGITEFTRSEIQRICEILGLPSPMGIFF